MFFAAFQQFFSFLIIFYMGSSESVPASEAEKVEQELSLFQTGQVPRDSLRYNLLLMCGRFVIELDSFYKNTHIELITQFIHDMGVLKEKEALRVVKKIIKSSISNQEAQDKLRKILSLMRVETKEKRKVIYISPLHSSDLYKKIVKCKKTPWGDKFHPEKIKFNSHEVETQREELENMEINRVKHTKGSAMLVLENPVYLLYTRNVEMTPFNFEKRPSKPMMWTKNIHQAAFKGDDSSVAYCLLLLPALLNCPDETGNAPIHHAAMGGQPKVILLLHKLGANILLANDAGFYPIHLAGGKKAVVAFQSIGCDLGCRNAAGESLIEIKTRDFDKKIIETILSLGLNIFEPNPRGIYWMQYAINEEYYGDMGYLKFLDFVRSILRKVKEAPYLNDPIYKVIVERKMKKYEEEDREDFDRAVTKKELDIFKSLLALGVRPDLPRKEDNKTNLMFCAEKDMSIFAEILLCNYCNPNIMNERGENTFWVAASLGHFETAIILRNHGADMNSRSSLGMTLLHVAYAERIAQQELFDFLLEAGASPNTKNTMCQSVQFIAFNNRDDEIAEMLQKKYNGDINSQDAEGNTVAHISLLAQDIARMEYYIERKACIEIKNNLGHTLFMISMIVFSDLGVSKKLLDCGACIDTQDINGDTPLIAVCRLAMFQREKFDFLIQNQCNINLQSIKREFAISVLLYRRFDNEASFLLSMGCQINDFESEFEPIVIALQTQSQYWVENLIARGANALNNKFPVLLSYIESPFFNFEFMKQMNAWNFIIGGPLQAAMRKKYECVCGFIWNMADSDTRAIISKTKDSKGMIPVSVAIKCKNEEFIDKLIKPCFDVKTPDDDNKTPFIYACKANHMNAMNRIWKLIDLKNANIIDKKGCSALSYTAENNNIEFCNMLFISNISIEHIKKDSNGIINSYIKIIATYNQILESVQGHYDEAKRANESCHNEYDKLKRKISELEKEIGELNSRIRHAQYLEEVDIHEINIIRQKIDKKTQKRNKKSAKLKESSRKVSESNSILENYRSKLDHVKNATRKNMLYNMSDLARYAEFDRQLVWGKK